MARQKGFIKLEGEVGDVAFYKQKYGVYLGYEKTSVSGSRIKTIQPLDFFGSSPRAHGAARET